MERREFLKKSLNLGLGVGLLFLPKGFRNGLSKALAEEKYPDLVALKGAAPEVMFDRGIAALGGIGRFVKPGQTVVIKPNISWDTPLEGAANTSPALVARIVKHCLDGGAKRVWVMDHSIEYWENSLAGSGIGAAVKSAGGVYAPSEDAKYYQKIDVKGKVLKTTQIHETLLECDVLVSVPVLKHHGGAGVSIAMKNLMGCVWNRMDYHAQGLQNCIADFLQARKPDLSVVDAWRVITRHGPRGGSASDVAEMKMQILSPDIVAADAASAKLLGREPADVPHIRFAAEAGAGEIDLTKLRIDRIVL
ncbi:MAG: DUF362 domain-containing protein [Synergistaceae bacterium]|jgi:uncharacterized protein (DUF362 family)|nr:DUF362 domain-containing protein [Synergistaceae bacterium]